MTVHGSWEDCDVEVLDFKRKPVEDNTTVISLYETTGNYILSVLKVLSLFIC